MSNDVNNTEVDVLLAGKDLTINGEVIHIKPYSWITTLRMAKPFRTVVQAIMDSGDKLNVMFSNKELNESQQLYALLDFIADIDDGNELIESLTTLISASIDKDIDYVSSLAIDEVIELGMAVFKVNKDFFAQRLPRITKMMPQKEESKKEK